MENVAACQPPFPHPHPNLTRAACFIELKTAVLMTSGVVAGGWVVHACSI